MTEKELETMYKLDTCYESVRYEVIFGNKTWFEKLCDRIKKIFTWN